MKRRWIISITVYLTYFLILLFVALPSGLGTGIVFAWDKNEQTLKLSLLLTASQLAKTLPEADYVRYALGGLHIAQTGGLLESEKWCVNIFAPGYFYVEAFFLKVFGASSAIILILVTAHCLLWACVFWGVFELSQRWLARPFALIAPCPLLLSGLLKCYCLRNGVIMTESSSTALLCVAVLLALQAAESRSKVTAIAAGSALACAAYIRAQIEMIGSIFLVFSILIFCCHLFLTAFQKSSLSYRSARKASNKWQRAMICLIVGVTFATLTVPYKLHNWYFKSSYSWLPGVDYFWKLGWTPESELIKRGGGFVISGGATVPAQINQTLAQKITEKGIASFSESYCKRRTFSTFLGNPVRWIVLKASYVPDFWLDAFLLSSTSIDKLYMSVENMTILMVVMFLCCWTVYMIAKGLPEGTEIIVGFYSSLIIASCGTFLFLHFECRYFYTLKLLTLLCFIIILLPNVGGNVRARKDAEIST